MSWPGSALLVEWDPEDAAQQTRSHDSPSADGLAHRRPQSRSRSINSIAICSNAIYNPLASKERRRMQPRERRGRHQKERGGADRNDLRGWDLCPATQQHSTWGWRILAAGNNRFVVIWHA